MIEGPTMRDRAIHTRKMTPAQKRKWNSIHLRVLENSDGDEMKAITLANKHVRGETEKRG